MKKMLMAVVAIVLIVVISVSATFAYLTSEAEVVNTFTVGDVEITLDEADVNEYGEMLNSDNEVFEDGDTLAARVETNEYKLIPGHTYTKDPIIHVDEESEKCWLYAKITNGLGADATINIDTTLWTLIDEANNVYSYNTPVEADADVTVFTTFTYSSAIEDPSVDATKNDENSKITVTAYAVQYDGFKDNAAGAWDATFGA